MITQLEGIQPGVIWNCTTKC